MTIYNYSKEAYSYFNSGLKHARFTIRNGCDLIPIGCLQVPCHAAIECGAFGLLAGFVVKVFIAGVSPLNCAIVNGLFVGTTVLIEDNLGHRYNYPLLIKCTSLITGLITASGGAYLMGIPFAPLTCTAVRVAMLSLVWIKYQADGLFGLNSYTVTK